MPIPRALGADQVLPRPAVAAVELAAVVRDAVALGSAREVLMLRLSRLPGARRFGHHGRLLEDAWDPLRRASRVRVFDLPNGDLVAVEAAPAGHLARTRAILDEVLDGQHEDSQGGYAGLLQHLRLPQEAAAVLALVERALGLTTDRRPAAAAGGPPIDAAAVTAAERVLAMADVEPVLHRAWACRLEPGGGAPEPCWEEWRIDMASLCAAVLPDRDPAAGPELRRRLRCAADRRLLAGLARPEALRTLRDCLLSLTPEAVQGAEFQRLDAMLPAALRGRLTVAVSAADVLADPTGFAALRAGLRDKGHPLALEVDAATAPSLVRPLEAGFDLLCLAWGAALPALGSPEARALSVALPRDRARMVLTGVDRPAAIAWGWEMGFCLFSGRLIERRRRALDSL
ncbi:MAG TPA: hypothetical protein VGM87_09570 [Roseomonas sp.]|jgi:hypothetical protein